MQTYASSSCFIFSYSSRVNEPSLSLNFCNLARDESKSGRGGAGGIYYIRNQLKKYSKNMLKLTIKPAYSSFSLNRSCNQMNSSC
jgi:hypothetical protein